MLKVNVCLCFDCIFSTGKNSFLFKRQERVCFKLLLLIKNNYMFFIKKGLLREVNPSINSPTYGPLKAQQ